MAANPRLRQQDAVLSSIISGGALTLEASETRAEGFYRRHGKRAFDLALGLPLLLLSLPLIALLALLVSVSSGWPPFYVARRMGRDGEEFGMLKLRTMVRDADQVLARWMEENPELAQEYKTNFKLVDDPRVTRSGRFLRRTSLDELPQLWNVIKGEMSLVGPRPYYQWELEEAPEAQRVICRVRPGLTGPWQVNGRNALSPAERMVSDCNYVSGYGLKDDLVFVMRTVETLRKANGL